MYFLPISSLPTFPLPPQQILTTDPNTVIYLAYVENNLSFRWGYTRATYFLLHYVCLKQCTGIIPVLFIQTTHRLLP